MQLALIVSSYNNADSINRCLKSVISFKKKLTKFDIKIILVDDGSTDETPSILTKFCSTLPSIELKKFDVGQSNPTYLMKTDKQNYVIRSKPLGNLLKGAHRIDREYKVMSALESSRIPVSKMHAYCEDTSIIGTEF